MNTIDPAIKIISAASLAGLFGLLFVLGLLFPLRKHTRPYGARLLINGIFTVVGIAGGALIVAPLALAIMSWPNPYSFGILSWLALPYWVEFIIGFLLLDLTFYYWHRVNHEVPLLWRFHNVHHIDPDVDVTTSFRFHLVEIIYSSLFRGLQVLIVGPSLAIYIAYEIVFQAGTMFHHSNVRLPLSLERAINLLFVTPRMHGIHHSAIRNETNSNYSVVFRWWDWIHRSLHLNVAHKDITIGVPAYLNNDDNRLWNCIIMPFTKQRDYWLSFDGQHLYERVTEIKNDRGTLYE